MTLCLQAPRLSELGFCHGFSQREGGVSAPPFTALNLGRGLGDSEAAVTENHRRLAVDLGYAPENLWEVQQVHGADLVVAGPEMNANQQADGIVAISRGTAIGIRTADCLPMLLADPESGAVTAVHCGWRGVAAGIVGRAVAALCRAGGTHSERLVAAIFPHIGPCCFEIGRDVADPLRLISPEAVVQSAGSSRPFGDLAVAVRHQLRVAGLSNGQIEQVPGCTACDPKRFFSYRRDAARAGRHLTVIKAGIPR